MNEGFYNTHTISDSDDNSVVVEDHPINITSQEYNYLSSPEEPDFFRQVVQCQKRKTIISPEVTLNYGNVYISQNDVEINETQNIRIITNPEPIDVSTVHKDVEFHNNYIPKLDIHLPVNDEKTTEMMEPKRKKRLTTKEMEEKKKEEKSRKDAKKKLTEELKRLNPKECMKYMTVHIDTNLQNRDYSEELLSQIKSTDAKFKVESNSIVSYSVTWSRQTSDNVSEYESFMLLIWDFDYVKNLIVSDQLIEKINNLKLYKTQLSIIIYSTADQLKKTKSKKNGQFTKLDMLNSLEHMLLNCHVSFRFIEDKKEIGLTVLHLTKSIAQKPFKLNKYKEEQEGCDWYASGHTKSCVTVDKNGMGRTQLWRQMLSQFPLCTLETSEAIASVYGSPVTLLEAYNKCSSRLEGETLLQDIPVRRGFGPLASNRRIGPELSKKIYTFFTDNTGCATLSQE